MTYAKRNVAKVNCQYCDKEVASTGIKKHEEFCSKNPNNAGAENTEPEDDDEDIEEGDDTEGEGDGENMQEQEEQGQEEQEVVTEKLYKVLGLRDHSFYRFTEFVIIKKDEVLELDRATYRHLLQQGIVEPYFPEQEAADVNI